MNEHTFVNQFERVERARALVIAVSVDDLTDEQLSKLAGAVGRAESAIAALNCAISTASVVADPGGSAAATLRAKSNKSWREVRRLERVAAQLSNMPTVADRLAEGEITFDHASSLARAAEEVGADSVSRDEALLARAELVPADLFAKEARTWTNRKLAEQGADLLQRQRSQRDGSVFMSRDTHMGVLNATFDDISFGLVRQAVDNHVDELYQKDGGRDGTPDEVRTSDQRCSDAIFELISGRKAITHEHLPNGQGTATTQLVITAEIGAIDGTDPDGEIAVSGTGPVPRSILESLSPDTELAGLLLAGNGQPLWLGRSQRLANAPQRLAVAVRDGGCTQCAAPIHRCDIHHEHEWERDGHTNIENLTALCRNGDHQHHHRQKLKRDLNARDGPNSQAA